MCDRSGKLIGWLDHELPAAEAAAVEIHVRACVECRNEAERFRRLSDQLVHELDRYCDASMASKAVASGGPAVPPPSHLPASDVVAGLTLLAAAVVVLFVVAQRGPRHLRFEAPAVSADAATVQKHSAEMVTPIHAHAKRVRPGPPVAVCPEQVQNANWSPGEPAIQIAIPADEMFPPGAVPEGFSFTANISFSADGSAQQLRLVP